VLLALAFLPLLSSVLASQLATSADNQYSRLTPREAEIVARINGTNAYNYDLELEKIATSNQAFRSAGSPGANEAANWVKGQFESFGLEVSMEPFEFTNWTLLSPPVLVIDDDGNNNTTSDQKIIRSFQSEHFSWPTSEGGVFGDLVTLPLPEARDRNETLRKLYNATVWNAIDTTGKVLLIGREVRWSSAMHQAYISKLTSQPPLAVVYTWWYDWMSFAQPMFSSIGGLPGGSRGPYYWELGIPVGWVNYEDGLWIRKRENSTDVSTSVSIPAVIGSGPHFNVVGRLRGSVHPEKVIIISGHYDTVMTSGFCDNGAGTAGVIELARVFTQAAREGLYNPENTLLFIAFGSEELGFVGSINYLKQHGDEIENINAVINLDSIGSDILRVTETFPNEGGLDLDEIVIKAAEDLGIKAESEEPGGSDQEAFRTPTSADAMNKQSWGQYAGISNLTRVQASTMISSYPLFYSDVWDRDVLGWIHTQYDNSTSSSTPLNWVEVDDLEAHIRVAALSVMRTQSYIYSPFLSQILTATMVLGIVVAAAVYFERSRVSPVLRKTYNNILNYITMKELIYIAMLTVLLLFLSFTMHTRIGKIEVIVESFPSQIFVAYYGYPFEMIGIEQTESIPSPPSDGGAMAPTEGYRVGILILWDRLFLNFALYFLLAFGLTYTVTRLKVIYFFRESK